MRTTRVDAAVQARPASAGTRMIVVEQNFPNPAQPHTHRALDLGTGWASTPVAVLFAGNRYEVKLMNDGWRNPKKPFAVKFPILNDGLHGATVVLQNGQQVPVLLSVHTTFFP